MFEPRSWPPARGAAFRRVVPMIAATTAFVVVAGLYLTGASDAYASVLRSWGIRPWTSPFLDTDTFLSALRCIRRGVDVFAANPCDPVGRVYDYSPLWLALSAFPVATAWTAPVGLGIDLAFLGCLILLPPGRGSRETLAITVGALSTAAVFAIERGNNDLVIFALAAIAATMASRARGIRLAGYGLAFLAGLLKYYPMTLMALATRERPVIFWSVAAASFAGLAAFIGLEGHDLARALALIPIGSFFGDMFGAKTLPSGLAQLAGLPGAFAPWAELALAAAALSLGAKMGATDAMRADLAALTESERTFLLAGALLMLGCFFTAQNIGYRAVHLVLLLPGLTALWRIGRKPRLYGFATAAILLLLWAEGWRHWIDLALASANLPGAGFMFAWLAREALWWSAATITAGLMTGLLASSEMGKSICRRWMAWAPRRVALRDS